VALSVEVRLAIMNPRMGLVLPLAPDQVRVMVSSEYTAGLAFADEGANGDVFRRRELLVVRHTEAKLCP
jgi:hypothetical protein